MKATLIKAGNHYYLEEIPSKGIGAAVLEGMIGSTDGEGYYKLSKQNCDDIFEVIDVEELAANEVGMKMGGRVFNTHELSIFIKGFNKAMELNGDKLFTEDDVNLAFVLGKNKDESRINKLINSKIQPTEIEVDVEMKKVVDETKVIGAVKGVKGSGDKITTYTTIPKLDENDCLILKKI